MDIEIRKSLYDGLVFDDVIMHGITTSWPLEQLLHVFRYLKINGNAGLVFNPSESDIDENTFEREDWSYSVHEKKAEELSLP